MKPTKATRKPRARRTGTTTIRRGMQFPHETDAEALEAWNRAVESYGRREVRS